MISTHHLPAENFAIFLLKKHGRLREKGLTCRLYIVAIVSCIPSVTRTIQRILAQLPRPCRFEKFMCTCCFCGAENVGRQGFDKLGIPPDDRYRYCPLVLLVSRRMFELTCVPPVRYKIFEELLVLR